MLLQFKIRFLFVHILKCNLFLWWKSWIFSIITLVFSVTWSFRNHANLPLKKHLLSMLKIVLRLHIFVETVIRNYQVWWIESWKEQHLLKLKSFVTLYRSLLSYLINFKSPCWINSLNRVFYSVTIFCGCSIILVEIHMNKFVEACNYVTQDIWQGHNLHTHPP